MEKYVCCICGKEFTGYGNNPYPVVMDDYARCCDECNNDVVIPTRILALFMKEEEENNENRD